MIEKLGLFLLGFLLFSFFFWRKLKEDYLESQIFTSIFIILGTVLLLLLISLKFFPAWWFWMAFLGFILGLGLATSRFRLRFYETLEAGIVSAFPWLACAFFYDGIKNSSWFSLAYFIFILLFLVLYQTLNVRYKDFGWYKSGKIGFAGLTTLGVFFLTRGVIAILFPFVLSFVGELEAIVSGTMAFLVFLAVFNLSKKT